MRRLRFEGGLATGVKVASLAAAGFLVAVMLGNGAAGALLTALDETIAAGPALSVDKSAQIDGTAFDHFDIDQDFDYVIDVKNIGPETANGVVLRDTLPTEVDFVSVSEGCQLQAGTREVVCSAATLEPDASFSISISVKARAGGMVENTAVASATDADPASGSVTTAIGDTTLLFDKSGPATAIAGERIEYQLFAENTGSVKAFAVEVTDFLPTGVSDVEWDGTCTLTQDDTELVCDVGDLAVDSHRSIAVSFVAPTPGTITNEAQASGTNVSTDPDDLGDSVTTTVTPPTADLELEKSAPASVRVGADFEYTIVVRNRGQTSMTGVRFTDPLPAGLTFKSVGGGASECNESGGAIECLLDTMGVGSSRTVTIDVIAATVGTKVNTATVTSDVEENGAAPNSGSATTSVEPPSADLRIEKLAPQAADIGDDFDYTIIVTNLGETSMTGVTVRDPLPAGVTFRSAADATCHASEGVVDCDLGTLAVESSRRFTIAVTAATNGMKVNTATVTSDVEENGGEPNSSSATTTVTSGEKILIFGPTDTTPIRSAVTKAGFVPVVVSAATWGEMTTADFRGYRALLLGDPNCSSVGTVAAAVANHSVWGAAVDGNVIIDGTDAILHGRNDFPDAAVRFASSIAGRTGAYVSLSCYYHGTAPKTPVPLLDAFKPGGFTATGVGCFNDAHIVANHPALSGITDAYLSNWGCSVHEAFDTWPDDFIVLAIARNSGSAYTAPDGTVGTPYILARGEGLSVISNITASTAAGNSNVGTARTVFAKVVENDVAQAGKPVTFRVISGPHVGTNGTATTDGTGTAVFSYTGTTTGTDAIEASYVASNETTQTSNRLFVTWVEAPPAPTTTVTASTAPTDSTAGMLRTVSATVTENGTPQVGKTVTFRVVTGPHAGTNGTATTDGSGTAVFGYTGTAAGTDAIEASYVDSSGATKTSNQVFVTWVAAPSPPESAPPAPTPAPPPGPAPPPEEPGTFNGQVVSGVVLFNGEPIRGLIQLESGDVIDATNGRIEIVTDSGRAQFYDGAFKITQPSVDNAFTRLELVGGDFSICAARKTAAVGADDKPVRRLWGNGTGKFQTKARYSAATVRGTTWLTEDRCDGSLTHSEQGTVSVYDFSLRRTRVLTSGLDYLAEAPPPPTPGNFVGEIKGQVIVNGVPLEQNTQIRSGDTIDVRNGRIELTTTSGQASFFSGRFLVEQTGDASAFTLLTLVGGDFSSCTTAAKSRSLSSSTEDPPKKTVRSLWGTGTGKFRTKSRFSSATVRGTNWLTIDRCDGSLTVVREGLLEIYDVTLNRTVQVGAGKQYLAPARRS